MPRPSIIPDLEAEHGKPIAEIVAETLQETEGNIEAAAERLGVPWGTMSYWASKYTSRRVVIELKQIA